MKLSDFIIKTAIVKNLKAVNKTNVLEELVSTVKKAYRLDFKPGEAVDGLLKREKIGSTGIGHGIAIPHAKVKGVTSVVGAFGRSETGIDFNALDGAPVNLIFLILAPLNGPEEYLQSLQRVSQAIKQPNFCKFLRTTHEIKGLFELFQEVDADLDKNHA